MAQPGKYWFGRPQCIEIKTTSQPDQKSLISSTKIWRGIPSACEQSGKPSGGERGGAGVRGAVSGPNLLLMATQVCCLLFTLHSAVFIEFTEFTEATIAYITDGVSSTGSAFATY